MKEFRNGWNRASVWLTIILGLLLSGIMAYINYQQVSENTIAQFQREADRQAAAIRRDIEVDLSILTPAVAFFDASHLVERYEFRLWFQSVKVVDNSLDVLGWIPRVANSQRAKFVDEARAVGLSGFRFSELQNGKLVRAGVREKYFPVFYIEPTGVNGAAFGFDLSSEPKRRTMLMQARDSGKVTASQVIHLVQHKKKRFSFLVVAPVYQGLASTIAERRETLRGFVVAAFAVDTIGERALAQIDPGQFHIMMHIHDGAELIYPAGGKCPGEQYFKEGIRTSGLHVIREIAVAGRQWRVCLSPSEAGQIQGFPPSAMAVFIVGIVLTVLLALQFRNNALRTSEIEWQVAEKTAQLRKSELRAEAIIDKAVIPIITIDETGIVQSFNRSAEKMFGYGPEEIIGRNVRMLMPEPHRSSHNKYVDHYLKTGRMKAIGVGNKLTGVRKDGVEFPMHLSVSEVRLEKRIFVGMVVDLSEINRAEEALRKHRDNLARLVEERTYELKIAKEAAETANIAKSAFLANMSHEIRTPMNSVLGFIQITLESRLLCAELRRHLETAYSSAKGLLIIINDILDVSKLESGEFALEATCLDMPRIVQEALKTVESQAEEKGIGLDFHFDADLPHCYLGDPTRLGQVIINLVGNAIKFTKTGKITIGVRASDQGDASLHFSVADRGIGMTAEQAANIFNPFTQADISTARCYGGTGLGLTISKQLVELMGGRIWVESELGRGVTFHFTAQLPVISPCRATGVDHALTGEASSPESPRRFQILLAEDVPGNATLAQLRLEQQGHRVRHVWNGSQAVEMYKGGTFDLILMDVMMPEMDGIEATRKIRALERESKGHITIIALTASIMKEDRQRYMRAGMDAVVGKPIILEGLFATMERVVPKGIGSLNEETFPGDQARQDIDLTPLADVVDIDRGLASWRDPLVFAKSLASFADRHSADAEKIQQLLDENSKEARMISHTLKGLAGNLSLPEVARLATEINAALKAGSHEPAATLLPSLQAALKNAAVVIRKLKMPVARIATPEFDSKAVSSLLQELLIMLDQDDPVVAEPGLSKLGEYLTQDDMINIRRAIDAFDFARAKSQTRILAERLGIQLEG
ncbi:CHASE domain-containing protein [Desulfotalea psychrophila]|uniref:Sensor protein FixL n=1 Tax=Desulfotalea psychrophila (strain LSv54 / DSM 12343) TaxID=177439 RepID=Q6AKV4_DESPS|nr:CHASE domain-containing protein [Desulfotalea psychrophila]CAG37021.1 related to two-component system sensory/regulatory protein (hybrid family) [Desulfotalea psychrophila LSv54]